MTRWSVFDLMELVGAALLLGSIILGESATMLVAFPAIVLLLAWDWARWVQQVPR